MATSVSPPPSHRFPPSCGIRFFASYVALFAPFAVVTPYLQVLLARRGFSEDRNGLIQGTLECMAVMAPPAWGYLSDRVRRPKLLLAIAVAGMVPAFLLFGLASTTVGAIAVAILFGLFFKPLIPLTDGITFRFIGHHGGDYGRVRIGGSVGFIVSAFLLEQFGVGKAAGASPILIAVAIAGAVQLLSVLWIPTPGEAAVTRKAPETDASHLGMRALLHRSFLCFTATAFLGRVSMMAYYGFFSLYLKEVHGFERAGYLWLIGPVSEIPVIFFSRNIMNRIGVRNLFALGLTGCAVRLLGLGAAPTWQFVLPFQFLHCLTFGAFHTASVTYVSRCVPRDLLSTAQTTFAAVTVGAGGILGGALGGLVSRHFGFRTMYVSFGGIAVVALVLLLVTVPALNAGATADRAPGK